MADLLGAPALPSSHCCQQLLHKPDPWPCPWPGASVVKELQQDRVWGGVMCARAQLEGRSGSFSHRFNCKGVRLQGNHFIQARLSGRAL